MTGLLYSDVSTMYGENFGLPAEEIVKKQLAKKESCAPVSVATPKKIPAAQIKTYNSPNSLSNIIADFFSSKEYFSDGDSSQQIASLLNDILMVLKIIMLVLVLLLIIKILEKKN